MISTQCPRCRKRFQLAEAAAGRTALCRCGASWRVAADGAAQADDATAQGGPMPRDLAWEDEIAGMFGPSGIEGATGDSTAAPAAEPVAKSTAPPESPAAADAGAAAPPAPQPALSALPTGAMVDAEYLLARARRLPARMPEAIVRRRRMVAVLCIVYGALAVLALGGLMAWTLASDFFEQAFEIAIAVGIVAGGILLWRDRPNAHAWAGLACLGLCFWPAWKQFLRMIGLATRGELLALALTTVAFLAIFSVPGYVAYWCLRYEQTRQELEEENKL